MKSVAIIQARMGSTRLPGKVLLDLAGEPLLARVVNRVRRARRIDETWIATTVQPADDAIAAWCTAYGVPFYRGSEDDVLDRYHGAAAQAGADVVVRITSDCPLIDPEVLDAVVGAVPAVDYACNFLPRRTFPRGLDAEAFTRAALERAQVEDRDPAWREHVTTFFQRHPEWFTHQGVVHSRDCAAHRWTVDAPEDLELVRRIYGEFQDDTFSWEEALAVLDRHPSWMEINRHIEQKKL